MKLAGVLMFGLLYVLVIARVQAHSNGFCYNANPCNGEIQVAFSTWHSESELGTSYSSAPCPDDITKQCPTDGLAIMTEIPSGRVSYTGFTNMLDNAGGVPDAPGWTAANCYHCDDDDDASSRPGNTWQVANGMCCHPHLLASFPSTFSPPAATTSFSPPAVALSPGRYSFTTAATQLFSAPSPGGCWPVVWDIEVPVAYSISCPASQVVEQSPYPACSARLAHKSVLPDGPLVFLHRPLRHLLTEAKVATFNDATCAESALLCPGSTCSVNRQSGQASSTSFPFGITLVDWALEVDAVQTGQACSHAVDVTDTTAPQNLVCSPAVSTICTSPSGAPVSFAAATANDCQAITWSQSHMSGATFPTGMTAVTFTAVDGSNSASCSFDVTVTSGPPTIQNCPADILVTTFSMGQASVTWTEPTATSGCMSSLAVTRTAGPAPGSTFDVEADNPTTVTYRTDPDPVTGQQVSCSFSVSFGYARIVSVSQFSVASVSELAMYIPFTITIDFVNIPQQSEVGRLWLSDGTNTVNIATSQTATTFDTGVPTTTFIGVHGVVPGQLLLWVTVDGDPFPFVNQLFMTLVTGN